MSNTQRLLLFAAAIGCLFASCTGEAKTSQGAEADEVPAVEASRKGIVKKGWT